MSDLKKKKGELIDFFSRNTTTSLTPWAGNDQVVTGNNNIVAGGNVTIKKNEKIINKNIIKPGPEHISPAQANKLQTIVKELVEMEVASGYADGDQKKAAIKWWVILRNHYGVTSYREIPRHLGDDAIAWMKQQRAINRPKIRKTDNTAWRNQHYGAINAKARELELSKGEIYALAKDRMGTQVTSLKQLSDQNLKKLYNIVMAL